MPRAILLERTGGSEELRLADHDPGAPSEGQVRLRHTAIGVNYIDVYPRTGLYPLPARCSTKPRSGPTCRGSPARCSTRSPQVP